MSKRVVTLGSISSRSMLLFPLWLAACGAQPDGVLPETGETSAAVCIPPPAVTVDARRSLAVSDLNIVNDARFSFQRVMQQLLASASATNTPQDVYQRLFDSNNAAPGFVSGTQHCDDQRDASGAPTLNNYRITCPRQEGTLAGPGHDPFCTGAGCDPYEPIALTNRFDLAPADGSNCGEYRIVFAKRSVGAPPPPTNRNLIIFEAVMPNPNPSCGLNACRPVAQFWADLTAMNNPADRAAALDTFYFTGLPGFEPVIKASHYTDGTGQIRTNQFMNAVGGQPWQLQEHKLVLPTSSAGGLTTRRVTVKTNPFGEIFNPTNTRAEALAFQDAANPVSFVNQVPNLAINDINGFFMSVDGSFNGGQSTSAVGQETDYGTQFGAGPSAFRNAIRTKLAAVGSSLSPANIIARAQAMSCAGCHQLSNNANLGGGLVWPPSLGFTHVSETAQEPCNGTACWALSPALKGVFLPARKTKLETFLNSTGCAICTSSAVGTVQSALRSGEAPVPPRVH